MYTLEKLNVCSNCFDEPDETYGGHPDISCGCRGRPRIDQEFLVCDCCGLLSTEPADTWFNRRQQVEHGLMGEEILDGSDTPEDEIYRRTSLKELTDEELVELGKMRIAHDFDYGDVELEKIELEERRENWRGALELSFIIVPSGYGEERYPFSTSLLFPDEYRYLQSIGITL